MTVAEPEPSGSARSARQSAAVGPPGAADDGTTGAAAPARGQCYKTFLRL
jgi:hypothetical protein